MVVSPSGEDGPFWVLLRNSDPTPNTSVVSGAGITSSLFLCPYIFIILACGGMNTNVKWPSAILRWHLGEP